MPIHSTDIDRENGVDPYTPERIAARALMDAVERYEDARSEILARFRAVGVEGDEMLSGSPTLEAAEAAAFVVARWNGTKKLERELLDVLPCNATPYIHGLARGIAVMGIRNWRRPF